MTNITRPVVRGISPDLQMRKLRWNVVPFQAAQLGCEPGSGERRALPYSPSPLTLSFCPSSLSLPRLPYALHPGFCLQNTAFQLPRPPAEGLLQRTTLVCG